MKKGKKTRVPSNAQFTDVFPTVGNKQHGLLYNLSAVLAAAATVEVWKPQHGENKHPALDFRERERESVRWGEFKKYHFLTGLLPWNAVPGKACGVTLSNICKTREVRARKSQPRGHVLHCWPT